MVPKYYFYIILILYSTINSIQANMETYKMSDRIFTCSNWLSSIIENICNNAYRIVKRDTSFLMEKMTPRDLRMNLSRRRVLAEKRWRRLRRQVASECCERPCTISNIIMYCPDDAKLLQENPDIFD